ncbi:MAG TPA: hypothetical protein VIV60_37335, partial [Polyangiaceae bacterium]
TAATAILRGAVADGASAVGVTLDNSVTLANATAKLVSVQNNGTEKLSIDFAGVIQGSAAGASLSLRGTPADGASAVGVVVDTSVALANASAKLLSVRNHTTEKAYVDKDGKVFGVGLDAGSAKITAVATPTTSTDAATKGYVDGATTSAKAWALLTCGAAGAVTVTAAFNVTSASYAAATLTVVFTNALSSANYAAFAMADFAMATTGLLFSTGSGGKSTTQYALVKYSATNTTNNWANGDVVQVVFFG